MIFSFSRLNTYQDCPYRFYRKYILGYQEEITLPLALGKAVHKTLEDKIKGVNHDEAVLNGLIESDFHPEVEANEIDKMTRYVDLPSLHNGKVEYYFKIPLDDSPNSPLIQGFIDYVTNDGSVIVDWKSNRKMYHPLHNHQLGLYSWAINQILGAREVRATLHFLRFRRDQTHIYQTADMEYSRLWALSLSNEINDKVAELKVKGDEKAGEIFPSRSSSRCEHCPFAMDCFNEFGVQYLKI